MKTHEQVMLEILDAAEKHGAEVVLRGMVEAGLLELTGMDEKGNPTYGLVREG